MWLCFQVVFVKVVILMVVSLCTWLFWVFLGLAGLLGWLVFAFSFLCPMTFFCILRVYFVAPFCKCS